MVIINTSIYVPFFFINIFTYACFHCHRAVWLCVKVVNALNMIVDDV